MEEIKKINVLELTNSNDNLEEVLQKISSGNAILFTGAGFSSNATNIVGKEPPRASELAKLIAEKGEFDGEGDLKFSANYFLRIKDDIELIELLKEQYTLKSIYQSHKDICSIPWRRIYTTNYDNSIELGLRENGLIGECITLNEDPKVYYKKKNICVQINGNIASLKSDKIPESFKLSTASYLSADSFLNSNWFYSFKKDLEKASAIVFVGYSLYDIEIQKILFESKHFKEKTFFITHEDSSKKSLFELSEFGKVYTIGTDGFAKELIQNMPKKVEHEFWLDCFNAFKLENNIEEIEDKDILQFLLHGKLDNNYVNDAMTGTQHLPYLIIRQGLTQAIELLKGTNCLTILSDFGNGKSVFLNELASLLTINGKSVFMLNNIDGNYSEDIDKLLSLNKEIYIIIDNYENSLDIIKYITLINSDNIKIILSTRSSNHGHYYDDFQIIQNSLELNIDILSHEEVISFSDILENAALWGEQAGLPTEKKVEIIEQKNKKQISHTLLNILNAPQMKSRIDSLLVNLFKNKEYQDTILAICILEIMNQPLTFSLISEVSLSNAIFSSELIQNTDFIQLFPSKNSEILTKSSLYARNLLKNHFKGLYTVNKLLDVAEKFQKLRSNGNIESSIYNALLKFSFIERSLPNENKTNMLIRYYEQLKTRIDRLERTPHFWLQYAMARIAIDDFNNAQNCLDTAYAKAYEGYDTSYLDAQQSRLWIQLSLREHDQNKSMEYFQKAHKLLINLYDDQYKYRQVEVYSDYFQEKYTKLSNKNKSHFKSYVQDMAKKLDGLHKGYFTESNRMDYCHQKLNEILVNI